ncbi:MAG: hypothetical protein ACRDTT_30210 [Pseudonocardiaceae bacterium]
MELDRCRVLLTVIAVAFGLAACGEAGTGREQPTGQARPPKSASAAPVQVGGRPLANPCALLTKAEVESIVRQPVVQETQEDTCAHRGAQPGSKLVTAMTVAPLPAKSPDALDAVARAVGGLVPGAVVEPLAGVGDDARAVKSQPVTLVFVRSGDRYLTVSVAGSDDPLTAARALVMQALPRLEE